METSKTTTLTRHHFFIGVIVLLSCIILFSIDKDTHSFSDLLKPGNLVALVIYFTPTALLSFFLFELLAKKYDTGKSLTLSLVAGIPLGFTLIICAFLLRGF